MALYYVWQIVIGILAGWLAGKIMRGRGFGLLLDLVIGIVGALLGGFIFGALGIYSGSLVGSLIIATIGAMLLLYLARLIR